MKTNKAKKSPGPFTIQRKLEGMLLSKDTTTKVKEFNLGHLLRGFKKRFVRQFTKKMANNRKQLIFKVNNEGRAIDRIIEEYEEMFQSYRDRYSFHTEKTLAKTLEFYPYKNIFQDTFPMMILRNTAKMFLINEIEATLIYILIKELGWIPNRLVRSSLSSFNAPKSIMQKIPPQHALIALPVLVHIMLIFYTAKKLLSFGESLTVMQQYIEITAYQGFGSLFNNWIRVNQPSVSLNMKELNRTFNKINSTQVSYKIPDSSKFGYSSINDLTIEQQFEVLSMEPSDQYTAVQSRTRKSSCCSVGLDNFDLPEMQLALSKQSNSELFGLLQPTLSKNDSICSGLIDEFLVGKRKRKHSEDNTEIERSIFKGMMNSRLQS